MKNIINVKSPVISKNRIDYKYEVMGEWKSIFENDFFIEYSCNIENTPPSIAIIPFVCNILPIAWLCDAQINLKECDENFFNSIIDLKKGYENMYPNIIFKGEVKAEKKVKSNENDSDKALAFFSGGVDAFNTLINHIEEKPILLTLWGADIKLKDVQGWEYVYEHLKSTSKEYNLDYIVVKSSLRECFSNERLHNIAKKANENWWHGFQHGIGIISHAAPVAYLMGIKNIYFASSFTEKDKGKITCASDPTIDNFLKMSNSNVIHDGYEFNRQDKIHNIVRFCNSNNKKIELRVCWQENKGKNCCECEKCWRTMLGIYAEGADPHDYGFSYDNKMLKKIKKCRDASFGKLRYENIQIAMRKNVKYESLPKEIRWFYKKDIEKINYHPIYNILRKVKHTIVKGK